MDLKKNNMAYSDLFKPSHLKQLCLEAGFEPTKQYGQNYLISERPIREMLTAAKISPTDTVVEIGPGFGVLTMALAENAKTVISFEIEQQLREYWQAESLEYKNVAIVWGNALKELSATVAPLKKYKIVANLPYQITARAIRTFFELDPLPECIVVMVQQEVADRITAHLGEKTKFANVSDASSLTVLAHYFGDPDFVTAVPRGSFWPSPKVDSAVVRIANIKSRPQADQFMSMVHAAFAHKRKKMLNNIAVQFKITTAELKEAFASAKISENARAESLTMMQWEALYQAIHFSLKKN